MSTSPHPPLCKTQTPHLLAYSFVSKKRTSVSRRPQSPPHSRTQRTRSLLTFRGVPGTQGSDERSRCGSGRRESWNLLRLRNYNSFCSDPHPGRGCHSRTKRGRLQSSECLVRSLFRQALLLFCSLFYSGEGLAPRVFLFQGPGGCFYWLIGGEDRLSPRTSEKGPVSTPSDSEG